MILQYLDISSDEKLLRSHTGLSKKEFEELAVVFGHEWEQYMRHYTWSGKPLAGTATGPASGCFRKREGAARA